MVKLATVVFVFASALAVSASPDFTSSEDNLIAREILEEIYGRDIEARDLDVDLQEREPFLPLLFGAAKAVKGVVSAVRGRRRKRDLEDIDELALRELEDLDIREVEDLDMREILDLYEREFLEDLD
ncbi:hypothetical protein NLJ89_g1993 [Agrocybe chaxingu]|uniref:Uncharacterized protein n=1 Tax=Agrocybe chaxingu TaxID=84603 RepID=A0A9W8MZ04_9AGAR|nr:hypothetical protein NLJ89_g1993 [Agrocybe chaxingu]